MNKQTDVLVYAVSMILKAALLAAVWAGKSRKRGLKSISLLSISEKDKEILFLRDRVYQLENLNTSSPIKVQYSPVLPFGSFLNLIM